MTATAATSSAMAGILSLAATPAIGSWPRPDDQELPGRLPGTSGHLNDPYTAAAITFQRGGASEVDIDHVVALGDAWQKGAQQWSASRRVALANDPLNLLAVDAGANRQKGDGDAATWLPANKRFRCKYVARQVAVKQRYHAG